MSSPEQFTPKAKRPEIYADSNLSPEDRVEIGQKLRALVFDTIAGKYDYPNEPMSLGQKINLAEINAGLHTTIMAEGRAAELAAREASKAEPQELSPQTNASINAMRDDLRARYRDPRMDIFDSVDT